MDDESVSLINYVPSFARGFNLLLVHDDTLSVVYLSSLLELYSFKVTATSDTSEAASMICHHEGRFKLIMAKANMPGMDALSFLDVVLEKNIPVIFVYSGGFDDVTRKALATGLCYFLEEPIRSNDLKYVWQHVYHSRNMVCHTKGLQNSDNIKMKQVLGANGERNDDDEGGKLKKKRTVDDHTMAGSLITTQCQVQKANGKGNHDDNEDMLKEKRTSDENTKPDSWGSAQMNFCYDSVIAEKKRSTVWTPELHLKFTEAIRLLGENRARPKQILSWMNEPYLTVRQVASHLQKHKLRLKCKEKAHNSDLPPVSTSSFLSHKAQLPSPSEVSSLGTEGFPAPKASLNENHNQNQFLVNNTGTEESEILSVDQNEPAPEDDDLIKMFVEDCDSFDLFENERNPCDVDQYSEMLRTVLDGISSTPREFDVDNTNRS